MWGRPNNSITLKQLDLCISLQKYFFPIYFHCKACDELENSKQTSQVSGYINKMKCIAQRLLKATDNKFLNLFMRSFTTKIYKKVKKQDPKTFEKVYIFAKGYLYLDSITSQLLQLQQQVYQAFSSPDYQRDYIPMDLKLFRKPANLTFEIKAKKVT